ncbi:MAG: ferredoxin--NADP(+) reductase [Deltaproteobacteria bacterium]|nr:ferredoxin--NADP(+) reductase [Deltaproteobacteria bacterium]
MDLALQAQIPVNRYRPSAPLRVTLQSIERLTAPDSPNDVRHLVLRWQPGEFNWHEGQSVGIVPPGVNAKGRPHPVRLFSIASASDGENGDGTTLALTIKRFFWTIPETGEVLPGLCSNYLCDAKPGDQMWMTGPVGREMVPLDWTAPMVLVATGTGIAPFRAFLQQRSRLAPAQRGRCLVVFGAQTADDLSYRAWMDGLVATDPLLHVVYARSREEKTSDGRRMYVQDRLRHHGAVAWELLADPRAELYLCGLKGMEDGIEAALADIARQHGGDWPGLRQRLRDEHRLRIEVY